MTETELLKLEWFQELCAEVQKALDEQSAQMTTVTPSLEAERSRLEQCVKGWSQSLADPELKSGVRAYLVAEFDKALERIAELDAVISSELSARAKQQSIVNPKQVADTLSRLADVLSTENASWGSVELAHHIDKIDCFDDGRVVVRTCKLGALSRAIEIFADASDIARKDVTGGGRFERAKARRLARRQINTGDAPDSDLTARAIWATNPNRFAGLDRRWFEEIEFQVTRRKSWAEANAPAVAALRKSSFTEAKLAEHFSKSIPTIRKALKIARKTDPELATLPRRTPRARWHEVHALEVAEKKASGMSTIELAHHYGTSDTTIRSAINYAKLLAAGQNGP